MSDWSSFGKLVMSLGGFILLTGALLWGLGKIFSIGRLPGDIYVQKGNFTFYFPIVTSIILSLILTLLFNLIGRR